MGLTDAERERLRVWSATKVMGSHSVPYPDYLEESQGWFDDKEVFVMHYRLWDPLVSLDQVFQVLERVMSDKPDLGIVISHMYQGEHTWQPPDPVQWIVEIDGVGIDSRIDDRPLAEALIVACADAAGEVWRDG